MVETRKTWTEAELMALPRDGYKYELVDGEIIKMGTSARHEDIGMNLTLLIGPLARKVGRLMGSSMGCWMANGNMRIPDLSFIRRERLPDGVAPDTFFQGAPDLCVEVISASERHTDILRKVVEYFDSGAQQVWLLRPETVTVVVYGTSAGPDVYRADDTLTAGDLVPGFSCRVGDLFATK